MIKSIASQKFRLIASKSLIYLLMNGIAIFTFCPSASSSIYLPRYIPMSQTSSLNLFRNFISSETPKKPIIQTQDWTVRGIDLPWNQVALDKSFGGEELVVFTQNSKFRWGFVSNRRERVHARWTQKSIELFVARAQGCGLFGCLSSNSYGLPKRIKAEIDGQDYFLKSVEQNTYELTPELKQAIHKTPNKFRFRVDERVNFWIEEESIPGLKELFRLEKLFDASPIDTVPLK